MGTPLKTDLEAFLNSFHELSTSHQSAAVQYILGQANEDVKPSHTVEQPPKSLIAKAHSCHVCQQLTIEYHDPPANIRAYHTHVYEPYTGSLRLQKEALGQGLSQGCLLTQWVLALLERRLFKFKSALGSEGILTHALRNRRMDAGGALEDLAFINSHQPLECFIRIRRLRNGATMATLGLNNFSHNRLLLAKLREEVSSHKDKTKKDYNFASSWVDNSNDTSSLRVFALADDPAADVILHRPRIDAMGPDDSLTVANEWLQECCSSHSICHKEDGTLPLRLIDIGTRFPIRSVRLYWTEEGERGRYAALTYCWGGAQPRAATRATTQDFTDGVVLSTLPQTLQDAIITTFKLGLRYIWIDCLCIIQDDPEDVAREIGKMAQIYSDATVTISAAGASTVYGGFLGSVKFSEDPPVKVNFRNSKGTQGTLYMQRPKSYTAEDEPISLRAWTLQEYILSQRILMFSSRDMWWICPSETKSQDGLVDPDENRNNAAPPIAASKRYSENSHIKMDAIVHWRTVLRDYTRRFLTVPSDKLPAIAGIASIYSEVLGCAYYAGLWETYLRSELLWSTARSDISRPLIRRAPSWSWASVDGEITHDWCSPSLAGSVEILHCHVPPISSASPFGMIDPSKAELRVRGEMAKFYWRKDKDIVFLRPPEPEYWHVPGFNTQKYELDVAGTIADADEEIPIEEEGGDQLMVVWALVTVRYPDRGLILAQVSEDTFRRVGIFYRIFNEEYRPSEWREINLV